VGEYFIAVCHTCRRAARTRLGKATEAAANPNVCVEIARFFLDHVGHKLEIRGDEYNM
jgi:hypothetical protein